MQTEWGTCLEDHYSSVLVYNVDEHLYFFSSNVKEKSYPPYKLMKLVSNASLCAYLLHTHEIEHLPQQNASLKKFCEE